MDALTLPHGLIGTSLAAATLLVVLFGRRSAGLLKELSRLVVGITVFGLCLTVLTKLDVDISTEYIWLISFVAGLISFFASGCYPL